MGKQHIGLSFDCSGCVHVMIYRALLTFPLAQYSPVPQFDFFSSFLTFNSLDSKRHPYVYPELFDGFSRQDCLKILALTCYL